jgi:hypothetical protein
VSVDDEKSLTEKGIPQRYRKVFDAIDKGTIQECSEKELTDHAKALCVFHAGHAGQDQTAAALLLNHLLLSKVLNRLQRSNNLIAAIVVFLSAMTLVEGGIQLYLSTHHKTQTAKATRSQRPLRLPPPSQAPPPK